MAEIKRLLEVHEPMFDGISARSVFTHSLISLYLSTPLVFMKQLFSLVFCFVLGFCGNLAAQSPKSQKNSRVSDSTSTKLGSKYLSSSKDSITFTDEELESILADEERAEEAYQHWTIRTKISATNRRTRLGVDVSNDKPSINPKLGVEYDINDEFGIGAMAGIYSILGEGIQGYWFSASATYNPNDWLTLTVDYNRDIYPTDPGNVFGDLVHTITGTATGTWDFFTASLSYINLPSSTAPAQYIDVSIGGDFTWTNFSISPSLNVSFVNQRVRNERIAELLERLRRPLPITLQRRLYTDISGLSSLSVDARFQYTIIPRLRVSLTPSFLVTPQTTISTRQSQFILSAGIQYSLNF